MQAHLLTAAHARYLRRDACDLIHASRMHTSAPLNSSRFQAKTLSVHPLPSLPRAHPTHAPLALPYVSPPTDPRKTNKPKAATAGNAASSALLLAVVSAVLRAAASAASAAVHMSKSASRCARQRLAASGRAALERMRCAWRSIGAGRPKMLLCYICGRECAPQPLCCTAAIP